jgi:hypothetical protein
LQLKEKLLSRFQKDEIVALLNTDPDAFGQTVDLALQNLPLVSWRAAWVLFHTMEENDARLHPFLPELISAISGKPDGHQRELLRIIEKLDIPEEHEGPLFDICMTIWEQVGKIPSVRVFAFRIILRIAKKYPELKSEIAFITQQQYTETLSPGIKASVERMGNGF